MHGAADIESVAKKFRSGATSFRHYKDCNLAKRQARFAGSPTEDDITPDLARHKITFRLCGSGNRIRPLRQPAGAANSKEELTLPPYLRCP
jgi:hypothetical protein